MIPAPRRSARRAPGALFETKPVAPGQIDAVEVLSTPDHPSDRLGRAKGGVLGTGSCLLVHASAARLLLRFADLRRLGQGEEHDLLAGDGADVNSIASHHPVGGSELGKNPAATLARVNDPLPPSDIITLGSLKIANSCEK